MLFPKTLYICATPIGHYSDISTRALEALAEADTIFCEDTRVTGLLLKHWKIENKKKESYHNFNEGLASQKIIERLSENQKVVLVSDAGTPCISDPGYEAVNAVREAGFQVEFLPGASAVLAALVLSGFSPVPFSFWGFVPKKDKNAFFEKLPLAQSCVLFDSPQRILDSLMALRAVSPKRGVYLGRELTKPYQEQFWGTAEQVIHAIGDRTLKGEICLVLSAESEALVQADLSPEICLLADQLKSENLPNQRIVEILVKTLGVKRNPLYDYLNQKKDKQ